MAGQLCVLPYMVLCVHVQLYKGSQAVWATGTDRESVKPTVLNVQVSLASSECCAPLTRRI